MTGAAVVGTGRSVAFERAVGRTVAGAGTAAVGVSDGTPEPVIEREPNREGCDHQRRRRGWAGANGARPAMPSMAKSSGCAAAAAVGSMERLQGEPVAVVVFGAERHDPR